MGGLFSSENLVDDSVRVAVESVNETIMSCSSVVTQNQAINVNTGCKDAVVNISDIDMYAFAKMNLQCAMGIAQSQDVTSEIDTQIAQLAQNITQALSLGLTASSAKNITRIAENLGFALKNAVTASIAPAMAQSQSINVGGVPCTVNVGFITMRLYADSFVSAVMNNSQVSKAVADLKTEVGQTAKTTQKGIFEGILEGIIALAVVIMVVVMALVIARHFMRSRGGDATAPGMAPGSAPAVKT